MPSDTSRRFWPEFDDDGAGGDLPADILKAAADELQSATKGHVSARLVQEEYDDHTNSVGYAFYLSSPRVAYRYLLFRVTLTGAGYPVDISDRPGDEVAGLVGTRTRVSTHEDAASLEAELQRLFGLEQTKEVVAQIRSLSRAAS